MWSLIKLVINKKLLYGILITCILVIVGISLFVLYGPTITQPSETTSTQISEVIINTDKIKYEQGERVNITLINNLDKSVWYREVGCGLSFWYLQKKEDGNWQDVKSTLITPCKWLVPLPPTELKPGESVEYNWDMHKYFQAETYNDPEKLGFVDPGTYRVASYYFPDCTSLRYPYECDKPVNIYSNEFIIKLLLNK